MGLSTCLAEKFNLIYNIHKSIQLSMISFYNFFPINFSFYLCILYIFIFLFISCIYLSFFLSLHLSIPNLHVNPELVSSSTFWSQHYLKENFYKPNKMNVCFYMFLCVLLNPKHCRAFFYALFMNMMCNKLYNYKKIGNYDRQTNQPTNRPTKQRTGIWAHKGTLKKKETKEIILTSHKS